MKASTWVLLAALFALSACGGGDSGGGSGGSSRAAPVSATAWTPGVFMPAANFAGQCTTLNENNWLRSWSNDLYLWYDEVVDRDPSLFTTPAYFDLLKTTATTPSGNPKDRFHFTYDTAAWVALSQSGVSAGYGVEWALLAASAPRHIVVADTEPHSPASAAAANLARGAEVLAVDGGGAIHDNTRGRVAAINGRPVSAASRAKQNLPVPGCR